MEIDPRARLIEWPSTVLGVSGRMYVYTPPEYRPDGPPLPVVYLLRGHEREWVNRSEDDSRIGTAIDVYERGTVAWRDWAVIVGDAGFGQRR